MVVNIFVPFLSHLNQIPGPAGAVNRFWGKNPLFMRITNAFQTNRK